MEGNKSDLIHLFSEIPTPRDSLSNTGGRSVSEMTGVPAAEVGLQVVTDTHHLSPFSGFFAL